MAKLTDTQLIVLSKAAAREDGLALLPDGMNSAAASRVGASLVSRKLMREVRSKPDMPVWREDEEGRGTSSDSSSSRLAVTSVASTLTPVRLPPGRARLATSPSPTGSAPPLKTIGIVEVALVAANAPGGLVAMIKSTLRPTRSAANAGSRS